MRLFKGVIAFIIFYVAACDINAQPFPVTGHVQLSSTHLPYIEDYLRQQPAALTYTIILNDLNRPVFDIAIRLTISGEGINIRTRPDYIGDVITLESGMPRIFTGFELASYFNPDNLDFSGITRDEYISGGRLPEGFYSICIEALDINRLDALPVSNTACGMGIIEEYDPPLILTPVGDQAYTEVQNILLQWQPMHAGMFPVEYTIYIYELEEGLTDDQVVNLTAPYATLTTMSNAIVYGPDQPLLIPELEYLFIVEIKDITGIHTFKNYGRSKVERFKMSGGCTVGGPCDDNNAATIDDTFQEDCSCVGTASDHIIPAAPLALAARDVDSLGFVTRWQDTEHADYYLVDIAYDSLFFQLVEGQSGIVAEALEYRVDGNQLVYPLYYRVRAANQNGESPYSNIIGITGPLSCGEGEVLPFECGTDVDIPLPSSQVLLKTLRRGDAIYASDFKVVIDDVTGNNPYSGRGHISLPFSDKRGRVNVRFRNVVVNADCRLTGDGFLEVTGAGARIIDESTAKSIGQIVGGLGITDLFLFEVEGTLMDLNDLLDRQTALSDYFSEGWDILDGTEGILEEYPYLDPGLVTPVDEAIRCYKEAALTDGNVNNCEDLLSSAIATLTDALDSLTNSSYQIHFLESPDQEYGFDSYAGHAVLRQNYNRMVFAGKPYDVPWKSVEAGKDDKVWADISADKASDIRIEYNDKQSIAISVGEGDNSVLTISGLNHNGHRQVYAIESTEDGNSILAGKLNVVAYERKEVEVVVVPVNGTTYPYDSDDLQLRLDHIFAPAIARVNLSFDPGVEVTAFDGIMDADNTGFLSNYTDEMDRIIATIEADEEVYYLFIVEAHEDPSRYGYMPRGRNYGFIYHQSTQAQGKDHYEVTIAHEIAHGAFRLGHIYDDYDALGPGETDNLMDYGGGDRLYAYQWDLIHNPEKNWSYNDADEEGEAVNETVDYDSNDKEWTGDNLGIALDDFRAFYNIAGQIILVPDRATGLRFMYRDHPRFRKKPQGALIGFTLDGEDYFSWYTGWVGADREEYRHIGFATKNAENRPDKPYSNPTSTYIGEQVDVNVVYKASDCEKVYGIFPGQYIEEGDVAERSLRISSLELEACVKSVMIDCEGRQVSDEICWSENNGEISNADISICSNTLREKLEERAWEVDSIRPQGRVHHIFSTSKGSVKMPDTKARILDERLYLLQYHTGIKFNVLYHRTQRPMTQADASKFAEDIGIAAGLKAPSILIVVPYQDEVVGISRVICGNPGVYDPGGLIRVQEYEGVSSGVYDYCISVFKWIDKPLRNGLLVYLSDESVMTFQRNARHAIAGYESINNYRLFRSRHWDVIENHKKNKPRYGYSEYAGASAEFIANYEAWEAGLGELRQSASIDEVLALSGVNTASVFTEEEGTVKLRESYMSDSLLQRAYALFHYEENNSPLATLKEYWGAYDFVDSEHLHEDISISEWVFSGIDVMTMVLAPFGLDFVGDLLGVTFAVLSDAGAGRYVEYGAGIFIPAIFQGAGQATYQGFKVIRHIDDEGKVVYKALAADTPIDPSDVWLGSIKATTLDEANRIAIRSFTEMNGRIRPYYEAVVPVIARHSGIDKNLLKQVSDEILLSNPRFLSDPSLVTDELAELLVKAGEGRTLILSRLSGFNDDVLATFTGDLARSDELVEAMSSKGELVEAWEVLYADDIIRNDIVELKVISEYLTDNPENLVEFKSGFDKATIKSNFIRDELAGFYNTTIQWGILDIEARPFGKGFLGKRVQQNDARVDAFELKLNPMNESFYLPHPLGGTVQFENIDLLKLQDGKLVMSKSSIYHVAEKPDFLNVQSVLNPAVRQLEAANVAGYKVEWLVSDEKAVNQLIDYFKRNNLDLTVKFYPE